MRFVQLTKAYPNPNEGDGTVWVNLEKVLYIELEKVGRYAASSFYTKLWFPCYEHHFELTLFVCVKESPEEIFAQGIKAGSMRPS